MRRRLIISAVVTIFGVAAITIPSSARGGAVGKASEVASHLKKAEPGTLVLDGDGVEFRSAKFSQLLEIHRNPHFDLSTAGTGRCSPIRTGGGNEPGERPFRFTLDDPMPAEIAAHSPSASENRCAMEFRGQRTAALAEIPAHHRGVSGGSNGTFALKDDGIDYVTENGLDSRTCGGFDVQYDCESQSLRIPCYSLSGGSSSSTSKQPLARAVFEKLWDHLYAAGLNLSPSTGDLHDRALEEGRR